MANKKYQIEIGADASQLNSELNKTKQQLKGLGDEFQRQGEEANKNFEKNKRGAKEESESFDRATKSIIASIQRQTAAVEANGRGTADFYEKIAALRGANVDALRPYIDGLKRAEAAQAAATGGLGHMEMSAKQTAAALRGVPAQFTDIFTSLASGQAPLTVFLQQGGQLKDMFGGAGNAARALGGYVVGLISPFTVLAGAALALGVGFLAGRKEAEEFTRQIVLTGNAAGVTAGQLGMMAEDIDQAFGTTRGKAAEVLAQLVSTGQVGASSLQKVAQAAIDLERVGGPAAERTVEAFAELGKKPLEASLKLNESTRFLTLETYKQIKAAEEQGRVTDAARIAQEAYATAIAERVPKVEQNLGLIERAWNAIKGATKEAIDAAKDVGRPSNVLQDQITAIQARIAAGNRDIESGGQIAREAAIKGNAILTARLRILEQAQGYEALSAQYEQQRSRQVENTAKWDKIRAENAEKSVKWAQEEARIREAGRAANASELEIAQQIRAAREKMFSGDIKSGAKELERDRDLIAQLSGLTTTYAEDLARLASVRARNVVTEEQYVALITELIQKQPFARDLAQQEAKAFDELQKSVEKMTQDRIKQREEVEKANAGNAKTIEQLRDEYVQLTAGKEAMRDRVISKLEEQALDIERVQIAAAEADANTGLAAQLRERIVLLRQEIALRKGSASADEMAEQRKASEKSAQDAVKAWERSNEQISQSLTDAIMRGGKSAGQYLRDYFRTLILRPIIEPIARGITSLIQGKMPGGTGAGGVGGAISSLMSILRGGGISGLASTSLLRAGDWLSTSSSDVLASIGVGLQGAAASIGKFAGAINASLFGRTIGQAVSGGFSASGNSGNRLVNLGLVVGGPLGAIAGGLINRAFGRGPRETQATGVEGVVSAAGFIGDQFTDWRQKGGWFRSDRSGRDRAAVNGDLQATLDAGVTAVYESAQTYAEALGLPADAARNFATTFKVVWGKTEDENRAALEQAIGNLSDDLAGVYAQQLTPFKRAGETISQTLQRLGVLQAFSKTINDLGGVFSRVARLGIDARESIIQMAGGIEAFADKATSFAQNFYGRDEIAGLKARDIQQQLAGIGITESVNTRDEFRRLVEGTDLSSADGQRRLVELLNIAGPFAEVADYLAETGKSLSEAARAAPESSILAPLFADSSNAQVQAINAVGDGIGNVVNRLDQLLALVRAGGSAAAAALAPSEVGLVDYAYDPNGGA